MGQSSFLERERTTFHKAKHIEIKHHFIRDYIQKGILSLNFVDTEHQWDDIFTKPFSKDRFKYILKNISM